MTNKPRVHVRTSPALIRAALLDAERTSNEAAGRRLGVTGTTIADWRKKATELGDWPNDQDIADWQAHEKAVAKARASDRRYVKRRYFAKGKLTVDSTGTRRRVQALYALGWTWDALAAELGIPNNSSVWRLAHGVHCSDRGVYRETAASIADLYERLCMTRPEGWVADRARSIAIRNGWVPPLAWDDIDDPNAVPSGGSTDSDVDPVVIERILAGDYRLTANRAEKVEACHQWVASGRSISSLARLTGWKVERYYKESAA